MVFIINCIYAKNINTVINATNKISIRASERVHRSLSRSAEIFSFFTCCVIHISKFRVYFVQFWKMSRINRFNVSFGSLVFFCAFVENARRPPIHWAGFSETGLKWIRTNQQLIWLEFTFQIRTRNCRIC